MKLIEPNTKNMRNSAVLKPDSKGRITLGKMAKGVSSFHVTRSEGKIILEPYVEIPLREQWLYNNKSTLEHVRAGINDSAAGKIKSRGSFSQYLSK